METYRAVVGERAGDAARPRARVSLVALIVFLAEAVVGAGLPGREDGWVGVGVGVGRGKGQRGEGEEDGGDGFHGDGVGWVYG